MAELSADELKQQLAEAKAQVEAERVAREKAEMAAAAAEQKLAASGAPVTIKGVYNGFRFQDGHRRIRDRGGKLCETQQVMDAALDPKSEKHAEAKEILDWYIATKYAYLVPVAKGGK